MSIRLSNTRRINSHPVTCTETEAHQRNAALFILKGQADRYLLALQNVARSEGTYVPVIPAPFA